MEEFKPTFPAVAGTKYTLRSTGEEVEVVAWHQPDIGARSAYASNKASYEYDWVTYIDSEGNEHIKEPLNIQLDFKPITNSIIDTLAKAASVNKFPTTRNCRIFDVAKELYIHGGRNYGVKEAVEIATSLVDKVGVEIEY